ncbi:MAG: hypothetical protein N3J91_05885 [Verrucomicrobiae bacterium]|nr:hypothetical protein [Verrucomicrobiae bacterium]
MNTHVLQRCALFMTTLGASLGLAAAAPAATFADDVNFLKQYTEILELSDPSGQAKVALAPAYQGRIMTSTAQGDAGLSYGWINRELIASRKLQPHINVFGGEDRFWMGPEGGQFSIFFAKGVPFDFDHWFTPPCLDTEPFFLLKKTPTAATFGREFTLTNYSGTLFHVKAERTIRLLSPAAAWRIIGLPSLPSLKMVAFESDNKITNTGKQPWTKASGLLSIWILGMFNPSPQTTIVVPIVPGDDALLGKKVTADYFGQVPPERLVVKDRVIFFKGDGQYRSKIGIGPKRSRGLLGSYDAANKVLTLACYTQPKGVTDYVNSLWKLQDDPFNGDVANSYNDGPVNGGKPLGPFYELESSSPAAALKPNASLRHVHTTLHLSGPEHDLDLVARATLGVTLQEITSALPK